LKRLAANWLPILIILILLIGIGMVGTFAWFSRDLPNPDKVIDRSLAQSTKIYARDGTTLLYEVHGDIKRTVINLEDIPEHAKWATIVVEDKHFFSHSGAISCSSSEIYPSFTGIVKAICHEAFGSLGGICPQRGGSTITQQFVKNAILTNEKSYTRKIRELILAYQIERKFSKDQILKMYFNEIPYGSSAYGIEAAAQTYLGKSAKDLTIAEGALLAALPQSPTYYFNNQDDWIARQQMIINLLENEGYISEEEHEIALAEEISIHSIQSNIRAPHFVFYVREYLANRYGEKVIEQGGLKVTTTLDITHQDAAEQAVVNGVERNESYNASNAALVSIDTKTGQVLAMVGSKDYFDESIDGNVNVVLRERQPGSSFKPIVYVTAFKEGYTPDTILFDLVTKFKTDLKDYEPKNYDLQERGPVTIRQALAGSLNIPAVKALYLVGVEDVLDTARDLGYTTLNDPSRYGLALVLGGGEVRLLDHVSAFATLAREGVRHPVTPIMSIEDKDGKTLDEYKDNETRVMDEKVVRLLNNILSDDGARAYVFGSGSKLTLPGRPVAAKTGTTNDYRDAWTIGYTPSLAAGVWVGNNDNSEMRRGAAGSVVAAPIWNEYMRAVLDGTVVETFKNPDYINVSKPILKGEVEGEEIIKVDKITEKRIPSTCIDEYPKEYIAEKTIKNVHSILHYVDKDNPRGPVPENPEVDPQYERFEEPVLRWVEENGFLTAYPLDEDCGLRDEDQMPGVRILTPAVGGDIATQSMTVQIKYAGPRTLLRAEYFIDTIKISESTKLSSVLDLSTLTTGFHTLNVVVYDTVENTNSASIDFNYTGTPVTTEPIDS
ncbi:transglycosylase domain-containing protein, partial [Patescibacteria group bacterium]